MPRIGINGFIGEIPRASARLLPDSAAQEAINCKLWSRELRPWREFSAVDNPLKTGPLSAIYPLGTSIDYWMHWAADVNVARGPIAGDTTERSYYTGDGAPRVTDNVLVNTGLASGALLHFDGDAGTTIVLDENVANAWAISGNAIISSAQSKFGGKSLLLDGTGDYVTAVAYALAPGTGFNRSIWFRATALTTARTLISGTADFKFAVKVNASQNLALYLGDAATWSIANGTAGAATIATGAWYRVRVAWNGATYKVYLSVNGAAETEQISVASAVAYSSSAGTRLGADHAGALALEGYLDEYRDVVATTTLGTETPPTLAFLPSFGYPKQSYLLGIPAPSAAPTAALGGGGSGTAVARAYVITHVTAWGEESAPSAASNIVSAMPGQTVTVNAFPATPAGDYQITLRRIYRVATSTSGAEYLFVAEIAIATTTYNDTLLDTQLGEVLPTTDWIPPPASLTGLISLPNGVMAGFSGNQVYLSVPFAPYAWPLAYRQVTDFPVVALGHFGTTIVVATTSTPYLINGVDPSYAAPSQYPGILPCVSKRGLVSTEYGVLYPSSTGLVRVTNSGAAVITEPLIDADDWKDFKPDTLHSVFYNGMYIAFYATGIVDGVTQGAGFIIEGIGTGNLHITELNFYRYAMHLDPGSNALYMADYDGVSNTIEQWEGDIARKVYVWRSKKFAHGPECFSAAKVLARYSETLSAEDVAAYQALHDVQIIANTALLGAGDGSFNGGGFNVYEFNGDAMVEVVVVPTEEPSSVEFKLYADGVLRHTESASSNTPFRMPGGYSGTETEIELSGVAPVTDVVVATSVAELQDS